MLEKIYENTEENKAHWANLFNHVGRTLKKSERLESNITQKIIEYFNWRFEKKNESELKEFTFWLEAECLNVEWRLTSYSKILDVLHRTDDIAAYAEMNTLHGMLKEHPSLVLKCFAKLTDLTSKNGRVVYIQTEKAKQILQAGFEHSDDSVKADAEKARESLLQCGFFSILNEAG